MLYLDNNATTFMPKNVITEMVAWCNRGNPSASYSTGTKKMMEDFKNNIRAITGDYEVIFTSGGSEANCTALCSIIHAVSAARPGQVPHVVASAVEHKSIIMQLSHMVRHSMCEVSYVQPTKSGHVAVPAVMAACKANTALICVMHANNETGAVNDVDAIAAAAHARNIPVMSDTVQTFGKIAFPRAVDVASVSFHKIHGPPGVGALLIKREMVVGYQLEAIIHGTQNNTLRGGTENLPGIGASKAALAHTIRDRASKNTAMRTQCCNVLTELRKHMTVVLYKDYTPRTPTPACVVLGAPLTSDYLPNTLLLSFIAPNMCNSRVKGILETKKIIVSIGSACNTSSEKASHVLYAMGADEKIKRGALRISFGEEKIDHKKLVNELLFAIDSLRT